MPKLADPAVYPAIAPTDDDQLLFRTGAGGDGRAALVQPKGYIDGLRMTWISGTQIQISAGAAYVPGAKRIAELIAPVTLTPSLAANTWYHVYLTVAGAAVGVEAVTTAPASPYSGTARAKTGDTSRRYIGSFRTNASSAILSFIHDGVNHIRYMEDATTNPLRILTNGVAAGGVDTPVSASPAIPVTGLVAETLILTTASSDTLFIGVPGGSSFILNLPPGLRFYASLPLSTAQSMSYRYAPNSPAGGAYIDIHGYWYGR